MIKGWWLLTFTIRTLPLISDSNYIVSTVIPDQDALSIQMGFIIEGPNTLSSEEIPPIILYTSESSTLDGIRSLSWALSLNPMDSLPLRRKIITIKAQMSDQWAVYFSEGGTISLVMVKSYPDPNGSFLQVVPDDDIQTDWTG